MTNPKDAISTIRLFLEDEEQLRSADGPSEYSAAPGLALDALAVLEGALSGEFALRGELAKLGRELVDLRRQRDDLHKANNDYLRRAGDAEAKVAKSKEAAAPFVTFGMTDDGQDIRAGLMRDRICDWFGPSDFDTLRAAFGTPNKGTV